MVANVLPGEFVVHTRGNPLALMPTVRSIVASLDPNLPVADVRSFEEVVQRSVAPQRFNAILLGIFSGLALLLATTGLYGVLSYSMSRRTSEIGLRVALGANSRSILRMAIGQGMRPALLGIALGAVGAWWLSRYFATLLFGVKPFDILTYAAVAALLLATALLACYLPGRRAMRIDPAVALRIEYRGRHEESCGPGSHPALAVRLADDPAALATRAGVVEETDSAWCEVDIRKSNSTGWRSEVYHWFPERLNSIVSGKPAAATRMRFFWCARTTPSTMAPTGYLISRYIWPPSLRVFRLCGPTMPHFKIALSLWNESWLVVQCIR